MYKFLEYEGKKHPIRISNSVIGEWQEETGKTDMKTMTFRDMRLLLKYSLEEGYMFAERDFDLTEINIRLMVDDQATVEAFLKLIPEFFTQHRQKKGGEPGKSKSKKS